MDGLGMWTLMKVRFYASDDVAELLARDDAVRSLARLPVGFRTIGALWVRHDAGSHGFGFPVCLLLQRLNQAPERDTPMAGASLFSNIVELGPAVLQDLVKKVQCSEPQRRPREHHHQPEVGEAFGTHEAESEAQPCDGTLHDDLSKGRAGKSGLQGRLEGGGLKALDHLEGLSAAPSLGLAVRGAVGAVLVVMAVTAVAQAELCEPHCAAEGLPGMGRC